MNLTTNNRSIVSQSTGRLAVRESVQVPLLALVVFVLALLPRAIAVGSFLTIDEAYHWIDRARLFLQAIRTSDWSHTNLVGHPGVTTMWLGASGFATHYTLNAWGLANWPDADLLRILVRLPVAIVTSLCIALSYPLLRRLLSARLALLAVLFWAGDPFLVAHSQILHVDALLTSFMTVAVLTALLAFRLDAGEDDGTSPRWKMLIASAVATGLAALTKSPSVVLVPMIVMIAFVGLWRHGKGQTPSFIARLWSLVVLPLLAWGAVILVVWFALWPATWLDPIGTVKGVILQASEDGMSPHGWGNYFWGQAVADPGPLFYPVATALRLTPWSLVGLLAAALAAILALRKGHRRANLPLIMLAVFCLLFTLVMTIGPKKFDRYVLPIFPALDTLAAFGILWTLDALRKVFFTAKSAKSAKAGSSFVTAKSAKSAKAGGSFVGAAWLVVALVLAANLAWHHPYEMAYYNQLLGGGPVAAELIPIGWGEGLEQAGAYINSRPDGADRRIATWYAPALTPFTTARVGALKEVAEQPGRIGYVVLYIDQEQRRDEPAITDMLRVQYKPLHTVRINGIDYAEIYQLPRPVEHAVDADFGPAIHMRGYDLDTKTPGQLKLTAHWEARGVTPDATMLFVHVLDTAGNRIGQVDLPVGDREQTSTWLPGSFSSQKLQIPIPQDVPSGSYWLAIGLYDPATGARLGLRAAPQPGAPSDGENALLLKVER